MDKCFVVMGFGIKTDLATGRKLNLDKSYNALIKPVVEAKGLECLRADEIRHAGSIDLPMYNELLTAEVVIADISTANANAFYELGLRHALKPRTTIVISENEMNYPFDLNHILINKYTHLGENIDYFEVLRFQKLLGETIDQVLNSQTPDSPIYTFLNDLIPPSLQKKATAVAKEVDEAIKSGISPVDKTADNPTLAILIKQAESALDEKQYSLSKGLFNAALLMINSSSENKPASNDSYLIHRFAYATYKACEPDEKSALTEAKTILSSLDLAHTNDAETVILAGRIEKKLYFNHGDESHLSNAILYFERGYFLLNNRFNGINLAFLLNLRVNSSIFSDAQDKLADMVFANRIRKTVLVMCAKDSTKMNERRRAYHVNEQENETLVANQKQQDDIEYFWITVNKAEANYGLGNMEAYELAHNEARQLPHEDWMMHAFEEQLKTLRSVLIQRGDLLTPAWKEA